MTVDGRASILYRPRLWRAASALNIPGRFIMYHLAIKTPEANLVEGMKWLQNTYTRRFNVRHGLWGRLFGDRYKSVLVEGGGYYYETLLDYIHLNPARAGLLRTKEGKETGVMDYPWSSVAGGYALAPARRAKWMAATDGLAAFGFSDTTEGRRKFVERPDRRRVEDGMERAGVPLVPEDVDARCSRAALTGRGTARATMGERVTCYTLTLTPDS